MQVRIVDPAELRSYENLWASCFEQPGEPFFDWFFGHYRAGGRSFGAWDGSTLASAAHLMPYRLYNRGTEISVDYLVGLATASERRQQGLAGKVLAACLADMNNRGLVLCVLMPAHPGFYYPYGWEIICHHLRYQAAPRQLRQVDRRWQEFQVVNGMEGWQPLDAVYRSYVESRNGFLIREANNWRHLLEEHLAEGGSVELTSGAGGVNGYVFYQKIGSRLNVVEMAYSDPCGAAALYEFLYRREDVEAICWDGPEDDATCYRLEESQNSVRYHPFVAGRVVNVERALNSLAVSVGEPPLVCLAVVDGLAPWNEGCYRFTEGFGWRREDPAGASADLRLDIGAFTLWYTGKLSLLGLWKAGRVKGEKRTALELDRWLPPCHNYIADYF